MEKYFRALLYRQFEDRSVAFNPLEPEPFDLVDLTRDITNSTRIYHRRTECVREALAGASLIVADSQPLANAVQRVLPRATVVALPFGPFYAAQIEPNPRLVVGLLNHTGEMEMNNRFALKLLGDLDREIMVYGEALPGIEGEVIGEGDYSAFAAKCDILLLPSLPGVINSTTLPLTMMASGTALLAYHAPGYYDLSAATGVQLLPPDPGAWRKTFQALESQPAKLRTMKERNVAYATRLNRESYARLASLADQFISPPAPLASTGHFVSEGCGCTKRVPPRGIQKLMKSAPTQPTNQPILEKES